MLNKVISLYSVNRHLNDHGSYSKFKFYLPFQSGGEFAEANDVVAVLVKFGEQVHDVGL